MRYRDARTACDCPARVEVDGRWIDVVLRDVSAYGIRLETPVRLDKGELLVLSVKGLPIRARVAWSGEREAGLRVPSGLPPATIRRIRGSGYQRLPPHWRIREFD